MNKARLALWFLPLAISCLAAQDGKSPAIPGPYSSRTAGQLIYCFEEGDVPYRGSWKSYLTITNTSLNTYAALHYRYYSVGAHGGLSELLDYVDLLSPGQTLVIDPSDIRTSPFRRSGSLPVGSASGGRFVMTAVPVDPRNEPADLRAIAFNFLGGQVWTTHLGTGSVFMRNALGRLAVDSAGTPVPHSTTEFIYDLGWPTNMPYATGNVLDGTTRLFQKLQPAALVLKSFLATAGTAGKISQGVPFGNRLTFFAFQDNYVTASNAYRIEAGSASLTPWIYSGTISSALKTGDAVSVAGLKEYTVAPPSAAAGNFPDFLGSGNSSSLQNSGGWIYIQAARGTAGTNLAGWFSQNGPAASGGDYLVGIGSAAGVAGSLYAVDSLVGNLRFVPSGVFVQGTPSSEAGRISLEGPLFRHSLTRDLAVMETEVTQQMWASLKAVQPGLPADPSYTVFVSGPNYPVQSLTWYQAVLFSNLLSLQQGLPRAYFKDAGFSQPVDAGNFNSEPVYCNFHAGGYRLPTEGEWEYFARAGTLGPFSVPEPAYTSAVTTSCLTGTLASLEMTSWFCANSGGGTSGLPHPVGSKAANLWGLKDVHGNVYEWCWDWQGFYPSAPQTNYPGPSWGTRRAIRGGGWGSFPADLRSGSRDSNLPSGIGSNFGFRLVRALLSPAPPPAVSSSSSRLWPDQGYDRLPNEVILYGKGFSDGVAAVLSRTVHTGAEANGSFPRRGASPGRHARGAGGSDVPVQTTFISSGELLLTIPAGLAAGKYVVTATNPDGTQSASATDYTVVDSLSPGDDLFGSENELWALPVSPVAGSPATIGLVVHRLGGTATRNVNVSFRQGDCDTGVLLGTDSALVSPDGTASTAALTWSPSGIGESRLCAIIDPFGEIAEAREENNRIVKSITVLPPAADQVPPHVDSFTIQKGAVSTTQQDITLDVVASDPEPGSGVAYLYYEELWFNPNVNFWVPVQRKGWLSYSAYSRDYPWKIVFFPGLHYFHVWAMDNSGMISVYPHKGTLNFFPSSETIGNRQVHLYRQPMFRAGQTLTATLTPLQGDPDLYVWPPDGSPPWVSNLASGIDEVSIVIGAGATGVYQVEVHGNTPAQYMLSISVTDTPPQQTGGIAIEKLIATFPFIPPGSEPDSRVAAPPVMRWWSWFPLVFR